MKGSLARAQRWGRPRHAGRRAPRYPGPMWTVALLLSLGACGDSQIHGDVLRFRGAPPENLLWLSIDTLRRDRLGSFGGDAAVTPGLDALIRGGVLLRDHRSCAGWTWPSVLCATRGIGPYVLPHVATIYTNRLPAPEGPTLASMLLAEGYATGLFSSNKWLGPDWGSSGGFEVTEVSSGQDANEIFALSRKFLRGASAPWFVHLHVREPHDPYDAAVPANLHSLTPIPYDLTDQEEYKRIDADWSGLSVNEQALITAHLFARYDAELREVDGRIAAGLADFERAGLLDDTLVVVWSDHGEQFLEHGHLTHAWDLYSEENDALALFWAKNLLPGSWSGATTHADLAPTSLAALGLATLASMSGLPVGAAPAERVDHLFQVARRGPTSAVVQSGFKLIYRWEGGKKELYDLGADPEERRSIYDPEDARVVALWEALLPEIERIKPVVEVAPASPGP